MIDTLTSLRFFFALMVFVSHMLIIDEKFSAHILKEGYVGVSFFFILSGFIIAYNYLQKIGNGDCSKRDFYIARAARIYPLHILILIMAVFFSGNFIVTLPLSWAHLVTSATLTNAFIPRPDFFFALNSPAWSLCCEQIFYLLFPFIITFAKSPRKLIVFILVAATIIIAGAHIHLPEGLQKGIWYVNPITRFPDFIAGILIFHIYDRLNSRWKENIGTVAATLLEATAMGAFILFYLFAENVPQIYRYSIYYWLPTSLVILVFAMQKGLLSRIISSRPFVIGGEISFGFYLTHYLIIYKAKELCDASPATIALAAFIATIMVASLSFYLYERPMNRIVKKWLGYRK